jgi:NADPH:quinone reductase-like Zn-dependent oxidoreductase/acyl dehydratase
MKALLCTEFGMPDKLSLAELPTPELKSGHVVITVKACGVNFPDTLMIQNKYQFKPPMPFSPGGEVTGVVKEVGEGVKGMKVGDRVFALTGWGGLADEVLVEATRCVPIPPMIDFVSGAAFFYNHATSYHALKDRAELKAGETLLVLGAGGGVGLAAVELGKQMGATVIAAASSEEKLAVCKEKGADHCINYATSDLRESLKALVGEKGVDVVFDPIGDKYAEPALRTMAWKGRYLTVGYAAGDIPKIPLNLALLKGCAILGVFWGSFVMREAAKAFQNTVELANLLVQGKLKPHVYKVYPLADAPKALEALMNRSVVGKAVVVTDAYNAEEDTAKAAPKAEKPKTPQPEGAGEKASEVEGVTVHEHGVRFRDIAAAKSFIGKKLGTSPWQEVSQAMIQLFADATLDQQWIHVDVERAKAQSPFGTTIAHGLLSLALTPKFMFDLMAIDSAKMMLNYGYNKVRFISPVPSGSRLRMSAVMREVESGPSGHKIYLDMTVEREGSDKPVCVAESVSVVIE